MATKFPPGQDMENISPKDLEEAKQYTKERKAYKDASQIGSEPKQQNYTTPEPKQQNYTTPEPKQQNYTTPEPKKTSKADRASRVNAMGDTYKKGGMTASSRADGCCTKGKTRGKMI
jgi:hypothetical protein